MAQENSELYHSIRTDLEARIIYEDFDGECFREMEEGMEFIVIVSMPDESGCWYEDEEGDEKFVKLTDLRLSDEKYQHLLEIKQRKGW